MSFSLQLLKVSISLLTVVFYSLFLVTQMDRHHRSGTCRINQQMHPGLNLLVKVVFTGGEIHSVKNHFCGKTKDHWNEVSPHNLSDSLLGCGVVG